MNQLYSMPKEFNNDVSSRWIRFIILYIEKNNNFLTKLLVEIWVQDNITQKETDVNTVTPVYQLFTLEYLTFFAFQVCKHLSKLNISGSKKIVFFISCFVFVTITWQMTH